MTDSVLLSGYREEAKLFLYSIVIVNEAHQRHVNIDRVFGIMKLYVCDQLDIEICLRQYLSLFV